MDQEEIAQRVEQIVERVLILQKEIDNRYEKMEIALTGTLRLLSGNYSVLEGLRADSERLKGYLLREFSNLRNTSATNWDSVVSLIQSLHKDLRK